MLPTVTRVDQSIDKCVLHRVVWRRSHWRRQGNYWWTRCIGPSSVLCPHENGRLCNRIEESQDVRYKRSLDDLDPRTGHGSFSQGARNWLKRGAILEQELPGELRVHSVGLFIDDYDVNLGMAGCYCTFASYCIFGKRPYFHANGNHCPTVEYSRYLCNYSLILKSQNTRRTDMSRSLSSFEFANLYTRFSTL